MTMPRYATTGCAAESQVRERTPLPGCAWIVSFNNGNSNNDHHDNDNFVRAVRASEYQHAVSFDDLYRAWRRARRNKQPSANQLDFEQRWADGLLYLQNRLNDGTWAPRPTTCFIAKRPKARPMHSDWVRSLRDQCQAAGVPFLFKQWGEWAPHRARPGGDEGGDLRRGHVRYLQGDGREPDGHFRKGDAAVARVGKKAAGRTLDGHTWDEFPKAAA